MKRAVVLLSGGIESTTTLVSAVTACPNEDLEPSEPEPAALLLTATRRPERVELPPVGLRRSINPRSAAISGKLLGSRKVLKRNQRVSD